MKRSQSEHNRINAHEYPGTRQLCIECGEPTERCEDDSLWVDVGTYYKGKLCSVWHGPLCLDCCHKYEDDS